jgi:predicted esterase
MSLAARANGYAVIMPRGRLGISRHGPGDQWTWPTAHVAQQQVETEVINEWVQARKELETELGAKFERVWVFGFSNGAYYASSLALRGRFPADGFAVFAGGGAPKPFPRGPELRSPIYVGYGLRDRAHADPLQLGAALRAAHWPSKSVGKAGVGHSIADSQLKEAIEFLDKHQAEAAPATSSNKAPNHPHPATPHHHNAKHK